MGVSVTSTYGLSRIDWDAAILTAAGGKIVQNGSDYAVVLPAYASSMQGVNTYTISGVAVDTKGNRSERSVTQVTVQAPDVNKQYSTFTPVSSALPADGKSAQVLTLTLRDEHNQPVDLDLKDIVLKNSALKSAQVSALTRKSAGVYTTTVTVGTDMAVTVTLKDAQGNAVTGAAGGYRNGTERNPENRQQLEGQQRRDLHRDVRHHAGNRGSRLRQYSGQSLHLYTDQRRGDLPDLRLYRGDVHHRA